MNQQTEFLGVILAAGKGSRMYPFSERTPKALLPIMNRPLLAHQLDSMAEAGIRKVIVVVGYYGFEIVRTIGDGRPWGLEIEYVDQERTLGIAHAVGRLESRIDRPFLLFLGDIFFRLPRIDKLLEPVARGRAHAVLAAKRESDPEAIRRNFAILRDPDGRVNRVIEKPSFPFSDLKGCGLYVFDPHIFDAIRRTPRTASRDEYEITDSIQLLIQDGFRVEAMEGIEQDINLTYPADLLAANQNELARAGQDRLIGRDFIGPPPDRIQHSVIGDRVEAPASVEIRDALIFSDVKLGEEKKIERTIIAPDQVVRLA